MNSLAKQTQTQTVHLSITKHLHYTSFPNSTQKIWSAFFFSTSLRTLPYSDEFLPIKHTHWTHIIIQHLQRRCLKALGEWVGVRVPSLQLHRVATGRVTLVRPTSELLAGRRRWSCFIKWEATSAAPSVSPLPRHPTSEAEPGIYRLIKTSPRRLKLHATPTRTRIQGHLKKTYRYILIQAKTVPRRIVKLYSIYTREFLKLHPKYVREHSLTHTPLY